VDQLITACDSKDPCVRFRAVWALGHTHDPRACDTIIRLTGDADDSVSYDASIALGILGDERGIPRLIELMATPDPVNCVDSAAAMGAVRMGPRMAPAVISLLRNSTGEIRRRAAYVLGSIGGEDAILAIAPLLEDPEPDTRIAAVESLAQIATPDCLARVEAHLIHETDEKVRKNAQYWVAELKNEPVR
jgi:HEAT repeat protein